MCKLATWVDLKVMPCAMQYLHGPHACSVHDLTLWMACVKHTPMLCAATFCFCCHVLM